MGHYGQLQTQYRLKTLPVLIAADLVELPVLSIKC